MSSEVTFWNPYTSKYEVENIYGEKWLRFSYENILGRIGLWGMVKRKWFSRWYGRKMDATDSRYKILPFLKNYQLNEDEFLESPDTFNTFNDFFYRKLKPEARPVDENEHSVIFPADGRHLLIPNLSSIEQVYAKGQGFDLERLLGSIELANNFKHGAMLISRLCPVDYHRFHFPVSGHLSNTKLLNGSLFSVNPIALRHKISIFWENKRYLSIIDNEKIGKVIQLLVGATCVGSVHLTSKGNTNIKKGDEYGYFSFGGSCVITLYPLKKIAFREDLIDQSAKGFECYFKFGTRLGNIRH
jgi:phosphatidylserine decarboxylase